MQLMVGVSASCHSGASARKPTTRWRSELAVRGSENVLKDILLCVLQWRTCLGALHRPFSLCECGLFGGSKFIEGVHDGLFRTSFTRTKRRAFEKIFVLLSKVVAIALIRVHRMFPSEMLTGIHDPLGHMFFCSLAFNQVAVFPIFVRLQLEQRPFLRRVGALEPVALA